MSTADKRRMSLEEAAQLIFQTDEPSPQHILKVRDLIARRVLDGSCEGRGSTNPTAVARYLAAVSIHQRAAKTRGASPQEAAEDAQAEARQRRRVVGGNTLRPLYSEMMTDYFMAVVRRRDTRRYSSGFRRAVLAGQLVCIGLLLAFCLKLGMGGISSPPEVQAVEKYLAKKTPGAQIESWGTPQSAGKSGISLIRVKYSFEGKEGKREQAEYVYSVQGQSVISATRR